MEALIGSAGVLTDEELAESSGLRLKSVRRLRTDEGFIHETNCRAKRRFLSDMPRVLRALTDAASDGKNASAMKLFLDVCRDFEVCEAADDGVDKLDVEELLQLARDAGVLLDGKREEAEG